MIDNSENEATKQEALEFNLKQALKRSDLSTEQQVNTLKKLLQGLEDSEGGKTAKEALPNRKEIEKIKWQFISLLDEITEFDKVLAAEGEEAVDTIREYLKVSNRRITEEQASEAYGILKVVIEQYEKARTNQTKLDGPFSAEPDNEAASPEDSELISNQNLLERLESDLNRIGKALNGSKRYNEQEAFVKMHLHKEPSLLSRIANNQERPWKNIYMEDGTYLKLGGAAMAIRAAQEYVQVKKQELGLN